MSKVAVVFWSATGNTETMANCVAEGANGTIVPCSEMNAAKLAEFDAVAFGCPAMGAESNRKLPNRRSRNLHLLPPQLHADKLLSGLLQTSQSRCFRLQEMLLQFPRS